MLTLAERSAIVDACRWVSSVVEHAPYVTGPALHRILRLKTAEIDFVRQHGADKVAHGDDITTDEHGNDTCLSC